MMMQAEVPNGFTDKNFGRLADLLNRTMADPALAAQIPAGAHIFYGAHDDSEWTQANLKLASRIWLGMSLGYVDEAPLILVYEDKNGKQSVIELLEQPQKDEALSFIEHFQERGQQEFTYKIDKALAV